MGNIIEIKGLTKTFQTQAGELTALRDINISIREGEIFGIIGMSGAGKSTLVRCINHLEKPSEGTVVFDGQDLALLNQKELNKVRRSMGMIFQQFNLLMQRTAEENVRYPLEIAGVSRQEAEERAKELLAIVGLADRAKSYPSQLSGGQKQRVAIARALATNPKALLCDEATSALDPTTTRAILELLKDINKRFGITIIVITHEMSVIEEICSRVAIISDSRIAEVGEVSEIFTKPQSNAAKKLVFAGGGDSEKLNGRNFCRIVFRGSSSFEPVVANMVLKFKIPVNIAFANTKDIDGKAFGQMILQLPDEDAIALQMISYLREQGLTVEEVSGNV